MRIMTLFSCVSLCKQQLLRANLLSARSLSSKTKNLSEAIEPVSKTTAKKPIVNHKNLVALLAAQNSITNKAADDLLTSLAEIIKDQVLSQGKTLKIRSIGSWDRRERPVRKARNPSSGEEIQCQASSTVTFTASTSLKMKHSS